MSSTEGFTPGLTPAFRLGHEEGSVPAEHSSQPGCFPIYRLFKFSAGRRSVPNSKGGAVSRLQQEQQAVASCPATPTPACIKTFGEYGDALPVPFADSARTLEQRLPSSDDGHCLGSSLGAKSQHASSELQLEVAELPNPSSRVTKRWDSSSSNPERSSIPALKRNSSLSKHVNRSSHGGSLKKIAAPVPEDSVLVSDEQPPNLVFQASDVDLEPGKEDPRDSAATYHFQKALLRKAGKLAETVAAVFGSTDLRTSAQRAQSAQHSLPQPTPADAALPSQVLGTPGNLAPINTTLLSTTTSSQWSSPAAQQLADFSHAEATGQSSSGTTSSTFSRPPSHADTGTLSEQSAAAAAAANPSLRSAKSAPLPSSTAQPHSSNWTSSPQHKAFNSAVAQFAAYTTPSSPTAAHSPNATVSHSASSFPNTPASLGLQGSDVSIPSAVAAAGGAATGQRLLCTSPKLPRAMRRSVWRLKDFKLQKRLYVGYASQVFKGTCMKTGTIVVLKIYCLNKLGEMLKYQLYREVQIHSGLHQQNIIQLYAAFQEGDRVVLVQEYAPKGDLFAVFQQRGGVMSEHRVVTEVLQPFLQALCYIHKRGVVHRDIKPENLLLGENDVIKLGDFGVALNLYEERAVTCVGTFDYMAPEVQRCPLKRLPSDNKDKQHLAYEATADTWSTGVLAYELLTGKAPFPVQNPHLAAAEAAAAGLPYTPPPTQPAAAVRNLVFPGHLSAAAKDFIRRALSERPVDRPTAQEMASHPWITDPPAETRAVPAGRALGYAASKLVQYQQQQQQQQKQQKQQWLSKALQPPAHHVQELNSSSDFIMEEPNHTAKQDPQYNLNDSLNHHQQSLSPILGSSPSMASNKNSWRLSPTASHSLPHQPLSAASSQLSTASIPQLPSSPLSPHSSAQSPTRRGSGSASRHMVSHSVLRRLHSIECGESSASVEEIEELINQLKQAL